jgi:hypothetical protein
MSEDIKKVHFGVSEYLEPIIEAEDDVPESLNSPLKARTGLGSTIKKLSPVSGAAQTGDAKKAYDRLLQQAALSMFEDEDADGPNAETVPRAAETPIFYKESATAGHATPSSHQFNRLESQQYNLSPPIPLPAPRSAAHTETHAAAGGTGAAISNDIGSQGPMTPKSNGNSSAQRDFISYRDAHSNSHSFDSGIGTETGNDIHQHLKGLRQEFNVAKNLAGRSTTAASSNNTRNQAYYNAQTPVDFAGLARGGGRDRVLDASLTLENSVADIDVDDLHTSPTAAAILNAHLSSIEPETFSEHPAEDKYNGGENREACSQEGNNFAANSLQSGWRGIAPASAKPLESAPVYQLKGLSLEGGEQRLQSLVSFLTKNAEEFSSHLARVSASKGVVRDEEKSKAHQLKLQTFSSNDLEAGVLRRHQELISNGMI